jgi:molybdopterin synthase sulfur carrier subunit
MINVVFFARIRDQLGIDQIHIPLPDGVNSLLQFTAYLTATHPSFAGIIDQPTVLVAVNQEFAQPQTPVEDGDEIAYFPPVTGG